MPLAAVPAAAWVTGAATLGGAAIASRGADRQATAATDTANQNNALQRDIFNQQRADLAPWRASGTAALAEINRRLGLGGQMGAVAPREGGGTPLIGGAGSGSGVAPTVAGAGGNGVGRGGTIDQRDVAQMAPGLIPDDRSVTPQATGTNVLSTDGSTGPQVLPGAPGTTPTTLPPAGGANALDPENRYGGFYASPGYQFRYDQGLQAVDRALKRS